MRREPEILLTLGDPESLDIGTRRRLVRAFVSAYGQGSWRGLHIPIDEVRRLAHIDLSALVRELWGVRPENDDIREFLIELIWQGPIRDCADLMHIAAIDVQNTASDRISAIKALLACGQNDIVRDIAENMLSDSDVWSGQVVQGVLEDIFPEVISPGEMVELIEQIPESRNRDGGFDWVLHKIVDTTTPLSEPFILLRNQIADLILRTRNEEQDFYDMQGVFGHFAPELARLCARQIDESTVLPDAESIRAFVIASRFGEHRVSLGDQVRELRGRFQENAELRRSAFWAELELMDEVVPNSDDFQRYYQACYGGLVGDLQQFDRPWLELALQDISRPERRSVALHALVTIGMQENFDFEALRGMLLDQPHLVAILDERTTPRAQSEGLEAIRVRSEALRLERGAREDQRLHDWKEWRGELVADPEGAFSVGKQLQTVTNLYYWLRAREHGRSQYDVWDKAALINVFSLVIADKAESAFRSFWRSSRPQLWSERPFEKRNSTLNTWIYGLCGVSAEADAPGWAELLSYDEALRASAYATLELNGLAPFIHDLVISHPAAVDYTIGNELVAELAVGGENGHLPILQDLAHTEIGLQRLLYPRFIEALAAIPYVFDVESGQHWAHHLNQILGVLDEAMDGDIREEVAGECARRYEANREGPLAHVWIRGLFRLNVERGAQVLFAQTDNIDDTTAQLDAVGIFAALFGGDDAVSLMKVADPVQLARLLGQLVRAAYAFIRREDDQVHEGVYSPDVRDKAESARNFLLSKLLETPGLEARRVILELATESDFAYFPDRLRLLARQRAAVDAEFSPYDTEALVALENHYEIPPNDRDGIFSTMMDRLDDLAHEVAHHDFTNRRTLRTISDEEEMQRNLALWIEAKANGAYVVTREDEVADRKRPDIRLAAVLGGQKAVAEVKLADRWSLPDFERALRAQLLGQYLRHEMCKAGCLLLTYNGEKSYWINPTTRKRMHFTEIVAHLVVKARELEEESSGEVRLAVFGLDLTDPPLEVAHR